MDLICVAAFNTKVQSALPKKRNIEKCANINKENNQKINAGHKV